MAGRRRPDPRAAKGDKPRRRRRRRGNYILYYILILFLLAVTGIVLSLTVFFKIEDIVITGTDKYPLERMQRQTGIEIGENLIRADLKAARKNLLEYPYVEAVEISRRFPDQVVVEITEAVPMAAVEDTVAYTLVSRDGRLLDRGVVLPEGLIPVSGVRFEGVAGEYPAVAPEDADEVALARAADAAEVILMLQYLTDALEESGLEIQSADFSDRYNIVAHYSDRITIEFGSESELARKMKFVKEVVENRLDKQFDGVLYADTAGRIWADPTDNDAPVVEIPEHYVFDEGSGTYVDPAELKPKAPIPQPEAAGEEEEPEEDEDEEEEE